MVIVDGSSGQREWVANIESRPVGESVADPQLKLQLRQQLFKSACMPLASMPTRTY